MAQTGEEKNQPTHVRIALILEASPSACASVMFIIARSTLSIALRPSSRMLTSACSAHVRSSSPSARPSTRRAPLRLLAARSFMEQVGRKRRRSSAPRASTMPAFSISVTASSIESLKAAACASPALLSTVLRSY